MMTCRFPLTDVISQIKACIFSVSMENRDVRLCYLSQTNNANQKQPQNNQLQALHFLQCQDKMPKMIKTCKLKLILISDGLFLPPHVWLCLWSFCCSSMLSVHALQKKKHVKTTSHDLNCSTHVIYRVTTSAHDFKFNVDTTAYRKDDHQNQSIRLRKIKLRFMSGCHIFVILLRSAQKSYAPICLNYICPPFFWILLKFSFPYCLWLYCLCLWPTDERKSNTTTKFKGKKDCTMPNKRLGTCSSEMLPICIYHCRVIIKKIKTVNICTCLTHYIISNCNFFLETVLALNSKDHLEFMRVEEYHLFPFTENLWKQVVTLHIYIVKTVYFSTAFPLIKKRKKRKY